jgi:uncharacterized protein YukE
MSYEIKVGSHTLEMHDGLLDGMQGIGNINNDMQELQTQLQPLMQGDSAGVIQQKLTDFHQTVEQFVAQHSKDIQNSADGASAINAADAHGVGFF